MSSKLEVSSKELEKGEGQMTQRTYDNIQGLLSYAVLIGGAVGFAFWVDYYELLGASDLSTWGYSYGPVIFQTFFGIFAVALIAKLWGAWVHNKFWLKVEIADKLHAIAEKIDPRRR
jgi:hypothetical protein